MVCPSCDAENPATNAYCGRCGTVMNDAAAVIPRYGASQKLMKRELVVTIGGVSALLAAAWLAWYLLVSSRSAANVVRAFIESDRAGQYAQQQNLILSTWDSRMSLSFFQALRQQSGSSPFQTYRIIDSTENSSNGATVNVEISVPQPTLPLLAPATPPGSGGPQTVKMTVTFFLGRQGNEWKIDSSQTLASVAAALTAHGLQQFQLNLPNVPGGPGFPAFPNLQIPPGFSVPPASPPSSHTPNASSGAPTI